MLTLRIITLNAGNDFTGDLSVSTVRCSERKKITAWLKNLKHSKLVKSYRTELYLYKYLLVAYYVPLESMKVCEQIFAIYLYVYCDKFYLSQR